MFATEGDLITCSGLDKEESKVFSAFRTQCGTATSKNAAVELPEDAKLLFKVTVEEAGASKTKKAPILYVGIAHTKPFSDVLALFNRQFSASCAAAALDAAVRATTCHRITAQSSPTNVPGVRRAVPSSSKAASASTRTRTRGRCL